MVCERGDCLGCQLNPRVTLRNSWDRDGPDLCNERVVMRCSAHVAPFNWTGGGRIDYGRERLASRSYAVRVFAAAKCLKSIEFIHGGNSFEPLPR
jgi:hypothetical protein